MKRIFLSLILGLFLVAATDMPAMAYAGHSSQVTKSHVVKASAHKKAHKKATKHSKKAAKSTAAETPAEAPAAEPTTAE